MSNADVPVKTAIKNRQAIRLAAQRKAASAKPRPLISPPEGYGVIWSAKSACSSVALWHFSRLKMLDAANYYHPTPHRFRAEVVEKSWTYLRWLKKGKPADLKWYWIVRDPVNRALSSFRHNLRFGYDDDKISAALGRPINHGNGYSFNDFLTYLEASDIYSPRTDFHIRSQQHRIMSFVPVRAFNIDEMGLEASLNAIEKDLGLDVTDFSSLKGLDRLAAQHHAKYTQDTQADCSTVLTADMARTGWPFTRGCLDGEALTRLEAIYALDYERIGEGRGNVVSPAPTLTSAGKA